MTFVVTSQPGRPRCGPGDDERVLDSASSAALHIAGASLRDGEVGRVGLELEAHCYDLDDPHRRPGWDELTDVIAAVPGLPGGSAITVEPGGAVELSGPPFDGPAAAIAALAADRRSAAVGLRRRRPRAGAARRGSAAAGRSGSTPAPGIEAMEKFFVASRTAGAGSAMMTSTASMQVNLDAGPRDGWAERVRLAHALGPTMIAIAANSPLLAGKFTGWQSTRQRVWGQLDSARCGPILGASGDDPCTDWARYALKAPVMLVHTPDVVPLTTHVPVRRLGRRAGAPRRPPAHHRRSRLPPDHAVPAGSPAPMAGDPLPRQRRPTRCGRRWCSRSSRCSTIRLPPRSPPRPSSRSRPRGTSPRGSVWPTSGCYAAAQAVRGRRGRSGARGIIRVDGAVGAERGRRPLPRRRLRRPCHPARHRSRRAATGPGRRVIAREDARPRPRAGPAADADPHRLRRRRAASSVQPADEPAGVGPRPHRSARGAVAAARRQPATGPACCRRTSKASTTPSSTPAPAGSICRCCPRRSRASYCSTVRAAALDALDTPARATTRRSRSASAWSSATRTSTTKPCCRRSTCAPAPRS